jgi:hypothetical protein
MPSLRESFSNTLTPQEAMSPMGRPSNFSYPRPSLGLMHNPFAEKKKKKGKKGKKKKK